MTYETLEWDPHECSFTEQEDAMVDNDRHVKETGDRTQTKQSIISFSVSKSCVISINNQLSSALLLDISNTFKGWYFYSVLQSYVNISSVLTSDENIV